MQLLLELNTYNMRWPWSNPTQTPKINVKETAGTSQFKSVAPTSSGLTGAVESTGEQTAVKAAALVETEPVQISDEMAAANKAREKAESYIHVSLLDNRLILPSDSNFPTQTTVRTGRRNRGRRRSNQPDRSKGPTLVSNETIATTNKTVHYKPEKIKKPTFWEKVKRGW